MFARALGQPGGNLKITACGVDADGTEICSNESTVLVRNSGKSRFENVSRDRLFVFADINGDGVVDRVPLFDDSLDGFLWELDNQGLRIAQRRFVEVPTNVN